MPSLRLCAPVAPAPAVYPRSLHVALPIFASAPSVSGPRALHRPTSVVNKSYEFSIDCAAWSRRAITSLAAIPEAANVTGPPRSEEHTSELQSLRHLVSRIPLEKKHQHHTR